MYHKWQSYDVWFLRYWAWLTKLLLFRTIFCPFTLLKPKKSKFRKNEKNPWRYYHFRWYWYHLKYYHKWQSYDVLFLRYEVWQTNFFVILDCFLPFYPLPPPPTPPTLTTQKLKFWKNWKKTSWRYHHFTQVYQKSWSYAILFPRYGA